MRAHLGDTRIRQPDRVEHPARRVDHAQRRRAIPRQHTHRLREDAAERFEIDHARDLPAIGGGSGGEHDGILEADPRDVDSEELVAHGAVLPSLRS